MLNSKYSAPFGTISLVSVIFSMYRSSMPYFLQRMSEMSFSGLSRSLLRELNPKRYINSYGASGIWILGRTNKQSLSNFEYSGVLNLFPFHAEFTDSGLMFTLCITILYSVHPHSHLLFQFVMYHQIYSR